MVTSNHSNINATLPRKTSTVHMYAPSSSLPSKWQYPGWRIEQHYSKGVLIGNWSEDRYKFQKGTGFGNTTNCETYRSYPPKVPDSSLRLKGLLRNCGLGKDQLLTHHGAHYKHNTISLYDQTYNRKYTLGQRKWGGKTMSWLPEISDHPLQGPSTNFGLKKKVEEKWQKQRQLEAHGDYVTNSQLAYKKPPLSSYVTDRAAPHQSLSCRTHPQDNNKDLCLRNMYQTLFKELY